MDMDIKPAEPPLTVAQTAGHGVTTATASDISAQPLDLDLEEASKPRTKLRLAAILSALYIALFIAALDQTIVSIAIPTITSDLHSASGYVWIGGAYLLAAAATGPTWAKCSDIWGRKPLLLAAVAMFAAPSILAALSSSMTMLIAARALQGVASGGLTQLVSIVIADLFSVRKRAMYMGYVGVVWGVAGAAGPLIGGALTEYRSWRYCFWINLPICGVTFILLLLFLDVHNPRTKLAEGMRAVDWFGTVAILAATLLLLIGLDFGGVLFPWSSPKVICLIVVGALVFGFFLFGEQRLATYPLMPLTVFKSSTNNAVFLVTFSHAMVLIGIEYYMPLYFQSAKQASPLTSGLLLLPLIGMMAILEIAMGLLIARTGRYREVIWIGVTMMTLGTGLYIMLGPDTSLAVIIGLEVIGASGPALLFQGPTIAIQNSVSQADTAAATACLGFMRAIAMALSVVVGGVVFQNSMDNRHSQLVAAGLNGTVLEALSGGQAAANVAITQSIQDPAQRQAVLEAFAWSTRNLFIMYTSLAAVAMFASVFIKHSKLNKEHTETKTGILHLTKMERKK
ncbi:MFS multidrug transporter-like protein [Coniochaeta sp. 2T2.1]|nr:MFS multidrug transporter-like protein [Coniochaeta sp. 2T2.1]